MLSITMLVVLQISGFFFLQGSFPVYSVMTRLLGHDKLKQMHSVLKGKTIIYLQKRREQSSELNVWNVQLVDQ